jgi:isopentenyl diphosphate isomerase/L-lactate dehydrogenase-like FMN-dependent dehydrogenase
VLSAATWAFYASGLASSQTAVALELTQFAGADDEITLQENERAFKRYWLRNRVLVNVESVDMSCRMLNT